MARRCCCCAGRAAGDRDGRVANVGRERRDRAARPSAVLSLLAGIRVGRAFAGLVLIVAARRSASASVLIGVEGSGIFARQETLTSALEVQENGACGEGTQPRPRYPPISSTRRSGSVSAPPASRPGFGGHQRARSRRRKGDRRLGIQPADEGTRRSRACCCGSGLTLSVILLAVARLRRIPDVELRTYLRRRCSSRFIALDGPGALRADAGGHRRRVPVVRPGRASRTGSPAQGGRALGTDPLPDAAEPRLTPGPGGGAMMLRRPIRAGGRGRASCRCSRLERAARRPAPDGRGARRSRSLISGFAEAGTLALIAEVARLVRGRHDRKRTSTSAASHVTLGVEHADRDRARAGADAARDADPDLDPAGADRLGGAGERCARSCSTPSPAPRGRCSRAIARASCRTR